MPDSNFTPVVRPCPKCGTSDRYPRGDCKACSNKRSSEYRKAHLAESKIYNAAWREANSEKVKKANADWYKNNTEKAKEANAAWAKAHPERMKKFKVSWSMSNKEKIKAKNTAWSKANPEKRRAYSSAYAKRNRDKLRIAGANWRINNPSKNKALAESWRNRNRERIKIYGSEYRKANPEVGIRKFHNRKARKLKGGGNLSKGLTAKLLVLQKGKCACCKQPLGDDFHLDHIMPLALGGSNTDDNIQLLRSECNLKKQAKHPIDFMQSRGFLL